MITFIGWLHLFKKMVLIRAILKWSVAVLCVKAFLAKDTERVRMISAANIQFTIFNYTANGMKRPSAFG